MVHPRQSLESGFRNREDSHCASIYPTCNLVTSCVTSHDLFLMSVKSLLLFLKCPQSGLIGPIYTTYTSLCTVHPSNLLVTCVTSHDLLLISRKTLCAPCLFFPICPKGGLIGPIYTTYAPLCTVHPLNLLVTSCVISHDLLLTSLRVFVRTVWSSQGDPPKWAE